MGDFQKKSKTGEINLDISILSNDEFYKKKVAKKIFNTNLGIESGKWIEIMKSPTTCYTNDVITWDVLFSEPDDVNNIKNILYKVMPDIIVISHKRADYVIKILDAWINTITKSQGNKLNPVILVGTKGKEEKVERLLAKYHEYLGSNTNNTSNEELNKLLYSFPTQKFDAMVKVYDDAREQIGSIAKSLISKDSVSLYFCVKNRTGTLAEICNKLAAFEVPSTDNNSPKPSFLNITVQKCPGSLSGKDPQRFLIESDVILEQTQGDGKKNEDIICKGLVVPTEFKETINKLRNPDHSDCADKYYCYDEYCIYRELCKTQSKIVSDSPNNKMGSSFAKLYLCSNGYETPGSVAHVLNNLLFAKTKINQVSQPKPKIVYLISLLSKRSKLNKS